MKLSLISEIQHKYVTTNINRSNVSGAYAANSINDLFHVIYGHDTHLKNHKIKNGLEGEHDDESESDLTNMDIPSSKIMDRYR